MFNHNSISRNEKNRSELVFLQSFSVLCYIFRKWEHFQITKFNRVGKPCSPATFSIQILLIFLRFELPPNFIFQCYRPQTWQFYLFFSCSFHFWYKVPRSGDPLLRKAYSAQSNLVFYRSIARFLKGVLKTERVLESCNRYKSIKLTFIFP